MERFEETEIKHINDSLAMKKIQRKLAKIRDNDNESDSDDDDLNGWANSP